MARKTLDQTAAALALSDTDRIPVVQSGTAIKRATGAQLKAYTAADRTARGFISVDDFGAVGNGVADDTAAFVAAELAAAGTSRYVRGTPGKIYALGDYTPLTNTQIDLTGCVIRRVSGARHAAKLTQYHNRLIGADFAGTYDYKVATTSSSASAGATQITVSALNGILPGMRIAHASTWAEGGLEHNEIVLIVGTTLTLRRALRGTVASGARILADFPMVYAAGPAFTAGALNGCWIRQNLFGLQVGDADLVSGNTFTQASQVWLEGNLGAGLILTANMAGEVFNQLSVYGGRYRELTYTGNGSTTTFAYPWELARIVHRWGADASVRVFVDGTRLTAGTQYTADPVAGTVTLTVAPASGAAVVVGNFEFSAFGVIGDGAGITSASSLERLANAIAIDCRVGVLMEGVDLGFFNGFITDGCSYAGVIGINSNNVDMFGCSCLYSPFPLRVLGTSAHWNVSGLTTSLWPDAEELSPTASKREITVGSGCVNINIDLPSWMSKSGYTSNISGFSVPTTKPLRMTPDGFAYGGPVAGRMMLYGATVNDYVNVNDAADTITLFSSGATWKYILGVTSGNVQIGNAGTGLLQWRTGTTAKFELLQDGTLRPVLDLSYDIGTATLRLSTIHTRRIRTHGVLVSALPAAATAGAGTKGFVTDATATTFASVVAGGGANGVPVYSDGTNWRIG